MAGPVPAWVAPYVGLPYLPGGRTREGLDCWGLVNLVWTEHFGRSLPSYDGPHWRKGASPGEVGAAAEAYSRQFLQVPIEEAEEGDALLIRMRGAPIHVGLVVAPGLLLHCEEGVGSVVERFDGYMWARRILGVYRYRP